MMGVLRLHTAQLEDLDVPDATFMRPGLTAFCGLDETRARGHRATRRARRAVLAWRITEEGRWCRRYGEQGSPRDTVAPQLVHELFGSLSTTLLVAIRRYRCAGVCARVASRHQRCGRAAGRGSPHRGLRWTLEAIVCQHLSVAKVAEALAVSWNTANKAVLAEGKRVLIEGPERLTA